MNNFKLLNPKNLEDLFGELTNRGNSARLIAGGTDLLPSLKKEKVPVPEYIISLNAIPGLSVIDKYGSMINVGALVTHNELTKSSIINEGAYVLAEACDQVGSWQIRNLATVGGNLANASPAADSVPALLVLDADIHMLSAKGKRTIKINQFFTGPGQTVLTEGEIIEKISFASLEGNVGAAFVKLGKRKAVTLSIVSAASYIKLSPDKAVFEEVRIAMGSVAPTPVRLGEAEKYLLGLQLEMIDKVSLHSAVLNDIKPIRDVRSTAEYRVAVAGVIVERALNKAVMRAKEAAKGGRN